MVELITYNAGINTGTKFLTKEVAFFLGGIYAANEYVSNAGKSYWAAPVRYNPNYSTSLQTQNHFKYISKISKEVNGFTVMKEKITGTYLDSGKNRLPGFSTFFESTGLSDLNANLSLLKDALSKSPVFVKKAFILGVIDGRGTPDASIEKKVIRYLSLDCPSNEIGLFFNDIFCGFGFICNYNTSRDRLEGGNPRKPQFRIKNVDFYMKEIGYISPARFEKLADIYDACYGFHTQIDGSDFLPGLKYLDR